MQKLLDTFAANPSPKAAERVAVYLRRHPMSECLLAPIDLAILRYAVQVAGTNRS